MFCIPSNSSTDSGLFTELYGNVFPVELIDKVQVSDTTTAK
ncbi:hypothetical protein BH10BAC2_BH10BAC2_05670 [soil metagenome]